jgi:V/A-type H+-transporting ATPase subunit I
VEQLEEELFGILNQRNKVLQEIADIESTIKDLEPLASLTIPLELYSGYENLKTFVGKVRQDPVPALEAINDKELYLSDDGRVLALFVSKQDEELAQRALSNVGFTELAVPPMEGKPSELIQELEARKAEMQPTVEELDKKISTLKGRHELFIVSTEEELAIEVEKAETPLRVATSDYGFVIDAWIPTKDAELVKTSLETSLGNYLHIDIIETRSRKLHDEEEAEKRFKTVPSKSSNGKYGQKFEYLTSLMSTPRYQETDQSLLIGIFLPMFFGLMLGDLGYSILFMVLGAYGLKNWSSDEAKIISTLVLFGGIWGSIFGVFMYGEMFGMHFIDHHHAIIPDWQVMLGMTFPSWVDSMTLGISKLDQATMLLKLSVYIGVCHLFLGYMLGFMNVRTQHGMKHAVIEKLSWVMILLGVTAVAWVVTGMMFGGGSLEGTPLIIMAIGAVVLLVGMALAFTVEGMNVILELPSVVGNILSYTRLAAIAMSKAGMALAFNYISIIMIAGGMEGPVGLIFGFLIFFIGHLLVWVLALISCGLHGLRLQYVEFMTKFFTGNGSPYEPLAVKRHLTKAIETEV